MEAASRRRLPAQSGGAGRAEAAEDAAEGQAPGRGQPQMANESIERMTVHAAPPLGTRRWHLRGARPIARLATGLAGKPVAGSGLC
jgi:hypothetical protein